MAVIILQDSHLPPFDSASIAVKQLGLFKDSLKRENSLAFSCRLSMYHRFSSADEGGEALPVEATPGIPSNECLATLLAWQKWVSLSGRTVFYHHTARLLEIRLFPLAVTSHDNLKLSKRSRTRGGSYHRRNCASFRFSGVSWRFKNGHITRIYTSVQ